MELLDGTFDEIDEPLDELEQGGIAVFDARVEQPDCILHTISVAGIIRPAEIAFRREAMSKSLLKHAQSRTFGCRRLSQQTLPQFGVVEGGLK